MLRDHLYQPNPQGKNIKSQHRCSSFVDLKKKQSCSDGLDALHHAGGHGLL